jgi:8-oxo-dGTP diphosphatase
MTMNNAVNDVRAIPRAAVSAAVFRDGKVLLVRRGRAPAAELWSLPGGHIEPGERAAEAVARELWEETGIAAHLGGIADAVDVIRRNPAGAVSFHTVVVVFCGLWARGEPKPGSDAEAAGWYDRSELARMNVTEGLPEAVSRAWARLQAGTAIK